jgi:hypothetical protein
LTHSHRFMVAPVCAGFPMLYLPARRLSSPIDHSLEL